MTTNDPKGKQIDRQMGDEKMVSKFDVKWGGQYQLCLQNQEDDELAAEIRVQSGELSNNEKITKNHLRPVEQQAAKVDEMIQ